MANNLIYKVIIYRVDNNHMIAFESDDFAKVETAYQGLELEWVTSTAEKRPFKILNKMHSLLPSLISEIKVETISNEEYSKQSNPYYAKMQQDGFSGVMNQNFNKGHGF